MHQTIGMSHVDPDAARDFIQTFLDFQAADGQMCSMIGPPSGLVNDRCSTDASPPNVALALWDNYLQKPNKTFLAYAFPRLERYIAWDMENKRSYHLPPTLHPTSYSLHPTCYILLPAPYILHPTIYRGPPQLPDGTPVRYLLAWGDAGDAGAVTSLGSYVSLGSIR